MTTLFEKEAPHPLADRLRPQRLADIVGQDHLLGPEGPIGRMVASRQLASMILWGPPGCGKTTIARLLAHGTDLVFEPLSAVFSGVADLRKVFEAAKKRRAMGQGTLLFVDEIHRFNRAQQDAFLPYVEDGTVILVGATTENPSFELIGALLSRAQVFVLRRLSDDDLETLLRRAARDGQWRRPFSVQPRRGDRPPAGRKPARTARARAGRAAAGAGLRQGPGGSLQPDQRIAQIAARLGYRCRTLLAGADAGGRRGPDLHPAPADPGGSRRHRARRPASGRPGARRVGHLRPARLAGRRAGDRPMRDLSRHRAEIERCLHSVWRSPPDGARDRFADAADAHPQRADAADARPRLRQGLCLRPRHRGRLLRPELFPGRGHEAQLLSARRARLRARGQKAPRLLGQAASARGDIGMTNSSRPVLRRTCGLAALVRI